MYKDNAWAWLCIGFFAQILFAFGGIGGIIVNWLLFGGLALYNWCKYQDLDTTIHKNLSNGTYFGSPTGKKLNSDVQNYYDSLPGKDGQILLAAKNVYFREMIDTKNYPNREDRLRNAAGSIRYALNGNFGKDTDLYLTERHGENNEKIDLIIREWVWDDQYHTGRHLEKVRRYPINY